MIALANISATSHSYRFFFVVRMCKIYSLSNFQVHSTVFLEIITVLYSRSLEFIYLLTGSLCLSINIFLFSPTSQPPVTATPPLSVPMNSYLILLLFKKCI